MKILIDCFGGDRSPLANVEGALLALQDFADLTVVLTGDEAVLKTCLQGRKYDPARVEIVHAPEVIGCDEKPIDAVRLKKESSMIKAIRLLRDSDDYSAMVSTGSTGALVAAALTRIGRVKGVIRPAFCPILPTMNGGIVGICDTGANVEVTEEHLRQFAIMSSLYMEYVFKVGKPRIALLNVGKEAEKGDEIRQKAYRMLQETPEINFVGNMESRDLLSGNYDVVVADCFSGNVLVKTTEGTALEERHLLPHHLQDRRSPHEPHVQGREGIHELPELRRQRAAGHFQDSGQGPRLIERLVCAQVRMAGL